MRVEREDTRTRLRTTCVEALLTFVALDDARVPAPVPPVALDDDETLQRQAEATERRAARLARSRRDKQRCACDGLEFHALSPWIEKRSSALGER